MRYLDYDGREMGKKALEILLDDDLIVYGQYFTENDGTSIRRIRPEDMEIITDKEGNIISRKEKGGKKYI